MKQNAFSRFESMAQHLVEGSFARLFGGQLELLEIANRIAQLMEDSQNSGILVSHYDVFLNLQDLEYIYKQYPQVSQELNVYVKQLAEQTELSLAEAPTVLLLSDPHLKRKQIVITAASQNHPKTKSTQIFVQADKADSVPDALLALDAFLIVDGKWHVALLRPLITLGRHIDNDIILESAAVSRRHAQIRWRFGHFILYDVSNRGRTVVNGEAVTEHVLQTGDVIGLSDVLLIYAERQDWDLDSVKSETDLAATQPHKVQK